MPVVFRHIAFLLTTAVVIVAPQRGVAQRAPREIAEALPAATVMVLTESSSGSGVFVGHEPPLILTNHHVVEDEGRIPDTVEILLPLATRDEEYRRHHIVERTRYFDDAGRPLHTALGHVIDSDATRDLALIQLGEMPDEAAFVGLASEPVQPGDRVHSIGNPGASGALWVYSPGQVRQIYKKEIRYKGGQVVNARIIETTAPINPGDSGGPVVDDEIELVGLVSGHNINARLVSYCIELEEIRSFLADAKKLVNPRSPADYLRRGERYLMTDRLYKADLDLSRVLTDDPENQRALRLRGCCRHKRGDYRGALEDLNLAIALDDQDDHALTYRASVYYAQKQYRLTVRDATAALAIDEARMSSHHLRALARYAMESDLGSAIDDMDRAIDLDPEDPQYYNDRAMILLKSGDAKAAEQDAADAIARSSGHPDRWVYYHNMGLILQHQDRPLLAEGFFKESERLKSVTD